MTVAQLATVGGVFAVLTFVHFLVDWLPQSHDAAMAKATDEKVRFLHCFWYAVPFVVLLMLLGMPLETVIASALILFLSHFAEDTYIPVYLWAKYVRRPMGTSLILIDPINFKQKTERFEYAKDVEHFKAWMATPLGAILGITVDQLVHLTFVLVVAILVVTSL